MKMDIPKIAVFDLDGTLWRINSHLSILNEYYQTHLFTSLGAKIVSKVSYHFFEKILYRYYAEIPQEFIENFNPPFQESALRILNKSREAGFVPLIVSNAPCEIVCQAAKRLKMDYLCAKRGKKAKEFEANYRYNVLMVCTDNKTDCDLLNIAEIRIIYPYKNRYFFKRKYPEAYYMEDE